MTGGGLLRRIWGAAGSLAGGGKGRRGFGVRLGMLGRVGGFGVSGVMGFAEEGIGQGIWGLVEVGLWGLEAFGWGLTRPGWFWV